MRDFEAVLLEREGWVVLGPWAGEAEQRHRPHVARCDSAQAAGTIAAALNRGRPPQRRSTDRQTVRVRVAVVVDERGYYGAGGSSHDVSAIGPTGELPPVGDAVAERWARELLPERWGDEPDQIVRLVWVEADVMPPARHEPATIVGVVAGESGAK